MTDTNAPDLASVMRRVTKLLAIAGDHRADANEAAAAASQAEKIMRKYQIENADLIEAELKANVSALCVRPVFANMKRDDAKRPAAVKNPPWGQFLAVAIAKLYNAQARQGFDFNKFGKMSASIRFYGYHADVEMCAFTFDYLVGVLIAAVNHRQAHVTNDRVATASFRQGFVSQLTVAIAAMALANQADVSGRGLVVLKSAAIEAAFGVAAYVTKKSSATITAEAFHAGVQAAKLVDVGRRGVGDCSGPANLKIN